MNLPKISLLPLVALLSLGACGGDDDEKLLGYVCKAEISAGELGYQLEGDTLTLTAPGQPPVQLARKGSGDDLFDAWDGLSFAEENREGRLTITFSDSSIVGTTECLVDGRVRAVVSAESPAEYTDTTINVLEDASASEEF